MPVPSRLASNIPPLTLPASYDGLPRGAGAVRTASFDAPAGPPAPGPCALLARRLDRRARAGGGALARAAGADPSVLGSSEFRSDLAARPRRGTSDEVEVDLADDEDGLRRRRGPRRRAARNRNSVRLFYDSGRRRPHGRPASSSRRGARAWLIAYCARVDGDAALREQVHADLRAEEDLVVVHRRGPRTGASPSPRRGRRRPP